MASPLPASPKIRFGAFELDAAAGRLLKSGIPIKLQPQPLRVLQLLAERPGQVVTREEIQRCLWGDSTFVDFERGINFSINQIRGVLSDNAQKPRYVETLPRIGYRFIFPVSRDGSTQSAVGVTASVSPGRLYQWPEEESQTIAAISSDAEALSTAQVLAAPGKRTYVLAAAIVALLVLATFGYAVQRWRLRSRRLDLQSIQITKLTDSGTVEDVAISPDGRYVVYALRNGEKQDLWLRQVATRSDVQILPSDTNGFHGLTFSRDGNYLYFVRSDKNDPFFKYLYSMPVLGGAARKLIDDVDSPVSFSPDGHQFVYEHCIPPRKDLELKIAETDGSGERLLTTIHNASCFLFLPGLNWSPNGRTVAVSASLLGKPSRWVLDIVSVASSSVRELFSSPDEIGRPIWLPIGDTLLVSHYDPQYHRAQLWTVSFLSGETRRFTNDLTRYSTTLDIAQDGRTIVTVAGTVASNVWVAPAADPLAGRQITFGELPMFDVAENADGRILAASGDGELWAMNPDDSQRASFGNIHDAGWVTPCGHFVIFMSHKAGMTVLTRVDADGSHSAQLDHGNLWSPACSPDGKFVFYVNFDQPQKIWRIPVEGGTPTEIAKVLGSQITGRMSISPDGKLLTYPYTQFDQVPSSGWHTAVISLDGSSPMRTFGVPGGIDGLRWSPDDQGLQYLLTRDGATNIWEQPLAGGEPKQLTNFTSGLIFDFNWSSDHTKLLLTRGSISSDVILLRSLR
jgi:Tol biopolymer transport system component/DNA-binding winged helix-turn-helix (wHTH) protein